MPTCIHNLYPGLDADALLMAKFSSALAWRLTSTWASPRGACDRGKGVHTSGR